MELAELKLWQMRYKKGFIGPCVGFIEATTQEKAEELGRKYCVDHPDHKFLAVEDPILATERPGPAEKAGAVEKKKTA